MDWIANFQDQKPTYKWRIILGVEIGQIKGNIEKELKFWWSIKDDIKKIENQGLICKWH